MYRIKTLSAALLLLLPCLLPAQETWHDTWLRKVDDGGQSKTYKSNADEFVKFVKSQGRDYLIDATNKEAAEYSMIHMDITPAEPWWDPLSDDINDKKRKEEVSRFGIASWGDGGHFITIRYDEHMRPFSEYVFLDEGGVKQTFVRNFPYLAPGDEHVIRIRCMLASDPFNPEYAVSEEVMDLSWKVAHYLKTDSADRGFPNHSIMLSYDAAPGFTQSAELRRNSLEPFSLYIPQISDSDIVRALSKIKPEDKKNPWPVMIYLVFDVIKDNTVLYTASVNWIRDIITPVRKTTSTNAPTVERLGNIAWMFREKGRLEEDKGPEKFPPEPPREPDPPTKPETQKCHHNFVSRVTYTEPAERTFITYSSYVPDITWEWDDKARMKFVYSEDNTYRSEKPVSKGFWATMMPDDPRGYSTDDDSPAEGLQEADVILLIREMQKHAWSDSDHLTKNTPILVYPLDEEGNLKLSDKGYVYLTAEGVPQTSTVAKRTKLYYVIRTKSWRCSECNKLLMPNSLTLRFKSLKEAEKYLSRMR